MTTTITLDEICTTLGTLQQRIQANMPEKSPTNSADTITLATLPALGAKWQGGRFAGVITQKNGTHCAVVLLPGQSKRLTWSSAMAWAAKQGGQIPTKSVIALLFANVKAHISPSGWYWTSETNADDASYAWGCFFCNGDQNFEDKSYEGCAVAVRCIPLTH